jgi:hypothetical protein
LRHIYTTEHSNNENSELHIITWMTLANLISSKRNPTADIASLIDGDGIQESRNLSRRASMRCL